jgi:hypothetical protein
MRGVVARVEVVARETKLCSDSIVPIVPPPDDDEVVDSNDSEEVRSGESATSEARFDCSFVFSEDLDKTLGKDEFERAWAMALGSIIMPVDVRDVRGEP